MWSRKQSSSCPPNFTSFRTSNPLTLTKEQLKKLSNNDEEEMEDTNQYKVGGYMPIELGQEIGPHKQFQVLRKLGWGSFSTVWLCRDKSQQNASYYAIKIAKSSTIGRASIKREIQVLQRLKTRDPNHVGYNRFVLFYDNFIEMSIYGKHPCLINEIMGKSLLDLMNLGRHGIQQEGVKAIIKQVCEGLRYLHEKCAVIHTDIKLENILVSAENSYICNMADYVEQFKKHGVIMPKSYMSALEWGKYNTSGDSKIKKEGHSSKKPEARDDCYIYIPHKLTLRSPLFINPNIRVKISDFGCAVFERCRHPTMAQPSVNRALEVILQAPYSFPIDMWSVGCLVFELSTGECLFEAKRPPNISSEEWHLCLIWRVLGKIPRYVAMSGKKSSQFFDSAGNLRNAPMETLKDWTIRHKLVKKHGWKFQDALVFEDFVLSLIDPNPTLRATSITVFDKKWINE